MPTAPTDDPHEQTAQLFAMLKSTGEFDQIEVRHIVNTIVAGSERDSCFQLIYHRCVADIASLCALTNRQHFQAISMIMRSLFELAVDIRLIDVVSNAVPKMIGFINVEKARCARKIIKFKAANPTSEIHDAIYLSFINAEGIRIDALKVTLWPRATRLDHWSGMNLKQRTDQLPLKYRENYEVQQPRHSRKSFPAYTPATKWSKPKTHLFRQPPEINTPKGGASKGRAASSPRNRRS
jgi:hypothetical protein